MAMFIGLMSGTSLDGVDGVLVDDGTGEAVGASRTPGVGSTDPSPRTLAAAGLVERAFVHHPFDDGLRAELLALNRPGADELHRSALAANALARVYAGVVGELLERASVQAGDVVAIGAHGQTVRHRPGEFDATGYTLQILNGALLAGLTSIDVVCDLRSADVAAGGHGAPLVPAFHAAAFARPGESTALLNLGGIANLTLLGPGGGEQARVQGFDCGPGNVLLDLWCERWNRGRYDDRGAWASSGLVDAGLLAALLDEPFLGRTPPKSTGRDLFNAEWLDAKLHGIGGAALDAVDVMATLAEFTACCAVDALHRAADGTLRRLRVCGGGALNADLMGRLQRRAGASIDVRSTAADGVDPAHVEALAFAWLARAHVERRAGNLVAVTGAARDVVLGARYPRPSA